MEEDGPTQIDQECRFFNSGSNLFVFETPSPYYDLMDCNKNITCSEPNETVHFEFEFFDTESCCDYLYISSYRVSYYSTDLTWVTWLISHGCNRYIPGHMIYIWYLFLNNYLFICWFWWNCEIVILVKLWNCDFGECW